MYVYHLIHLLACGVCQISAAAEQLVQYCQEHRRADPLLTGINTSSNPFKDKKTCVLLWTASAAVALLFPGLRTSYQTVHLKIKDIQSATEQYNSTVCNI